MTNTKTNKPVLNRTNESKAVFSIARMTDSEIEQYLHYLNNVYNQLGIDQFRDNTALVEVDGVLDFTSGVNTLKHLQRLKEIFLNDGIHQGKTMEELVDLVKSEFKEYISTKDNEIVKFLTDYSNYIMNYSEFEDEDYDPGYDYDTLMRKLMRKIDDIMCGIASYNEYEGVSEQVHVDSYLNKLDSFDGMVEPDRLGFIFRNGVVDFGYNKNSNETLTDIINQIKSFYQDEYYVYSCEQWVRVNTIISVIVSKCLNIKFQLD